MKASDHHRDGSGWQPLTDVRDLERLSAHELTQRVAPLLRKGGLCPTPDARERHEQNVPGALVELANGWRENPSISDREVSFGKYVAARLVPQLKAIDQEQHPELYDSHRAYHPGWAPLPLAEDQPEPAGSQLLEPASIAVELNRHGIAAPSQAGVLRLLAGVRDGSIDGSGYRAAVALGMSADAARRRPATRPLIAAEQVVAAAQQANGLSWDEIANLIAAAPEPDESQKFTVKW
jgi:hypothetical protein